MKKYKYPDDEQRLRALFADHVIAGKSVMLDAEGVLPPRFSDFDLQEIGVCASDLITDGLLVVSGERDNAVYVISASHGYNPILVVPAKALFRLKQKEDNRVKDNALSINCPNRCKKTVQWLLTNAWVICVGVIIGLVTLYISKVLRL
jgi:hypothetical protein